jgi:hypothetical protein
MDGEQEGDNMRLAKPGEEAHIEIEGKKYRIQRKDSYGRIKELRGLKGIKFFVSDVTLQYLATIAPSD